MVLVIAALGAASRGTRHADPLRADRAGRSGSSSPSPRCSPASEAWARLVPTSAGLGRPARPAPAAACSTPRPSRPRCPTPGAGPARRRRRRARGPEHRHAVRLGAGTRCWPACRCCRSTSAARASAPRRRTVVGVPAAGHRLAAHPRRRPARPRPRRGAACRRRPGSAGCRRRPGARAWWPSCWRRVIAVVLPVRGSTPVGHRRRRGRHRRRHRGRHRDGPADPRSAGVDAAQPRPGQRHRGPHATARRPRIPPTCASACWRTSTAPRGGRARASTAGATRASPCPATSSARSSPRTAATACAAATASPTTSRSTNLQNTYLPLPYPMSQVDDVAGPRHGLAAWTRAPASPSPTRPRHRPGPTGSPRSTPGSSPRELRDAVAATGRLLAAARPPRRAVAEDRRARARRSPRPPRTPYDKAMALQRWFTRDGGFTLQHRRAQRRRRRLHRRVPRPAGRLLRAVRRRDGADGPHAGHPLARRRRLHPGQRGRGRHLAGHRARRARLAGAVVRRVSAGCASSRRRARVRPS